MKSCAAYVQGTLNSWDPRVLIVAGFLLAALTAITPYAFFIWVILLIMALYPVYMEVKEPHWTIDRVMPLRGIYKVSTDSGYMFACHSENGWSREASTPDGAMLNFCNSLKPTRPIHGWEPITIMVI